MKISVLLILQRNHTWRFSSFKNTLRCLMRYLDLACRLGNFSTILRASPYEITFFTVHYEAYFFLKHSILYGFKVVRNHYLRPPSLMGDAKFKQNIWVTGDFQLTLRETISKTVVTKPNYLNTNLLLTTKLMPIQTVKNTSVVWFYHLKSIPPFLKLTVLRADNSKH